MFKFYRHVLAAAVVALCLAACQKAAASPPKPVIGFALHRGALSAPDTLVGTFQCTGAAPNTACGVTASATGGTLNAPASVPVGQSGTITIVCAAPASTVTFTGALFGTAPGYTNSPPTPTVTQALSCPAKAAGTPAGFVIQFVVKSGG